MRKNNYLKQLSLALLCLVGGTMTCAAYDFYVDGIYYERNADRYTVSVVNDGISEPGVSTDYEGDVVIPSTVTYEGETYTVTRIGNSAF